MRRRAFIRWPVHGNVLEALLEGRLEIGAHTLFEPGVWITAPGSAQIRIGSGCFLNLGVMVAALELVEIGDHCMFANGCFVSDANHRFDDPEMPVPWQGFTTRGPTRIGDNVWCGANVVITDGVTVGERCVIGANSVVTRDLPAFSVASGAPARVIRMIEYPRGSGGRDADDQYPRVSGGRDADEEYPGGSVGRDVDDQYPRLPGAGGTRSRPSP
jgi:acetyltransferase-like isoleucine patch superfamily enzyme